MGIPTGAILRAIRENRSLSGLLGGAIGGGLGALASDEEDSMGMLGGAVLGGVAGLYGGGRKIRPQRFPESSALSPDIHRWGQLPTAEAPSTMTRGQRLHAGQVDEISPWYQGDLDLEKVVSNLVHGGANEAELQQMDLMKRLKELTELGLREHAQTWLGSSTVPRSWDTARRLAREAYDEAALQHGLGNMEAKAKALAEHDRLQEMMANRTVATRNMSEEDFLSERAAQEAELGPEHYGKVADFGKMFQDKLWELTTARKEAGHIDPKVYAEWEDQRNRGIPYFPAMRASRDVEKLPTEQLSILQRMLELSPEGELYRQPRALRDFASRRGLSVSGFDELEGHLQMKGSDLPLENPLAAGFHYMEESFRQAKRNDATKTLIDGAYALAPPRSDGTPFIRELHPGEVMKRDEGAVSFLENGQTRHFAVPVEWADVLHGAEAKSVNKGLEIMSKVMRINSAMITGKNIAFLVPNVVKDLMDTFILARQNPKNAMAFLQYWAKAFQAVRTGDVTDPLMREAFAEGAVGGNITKQLRSEPEWMRAAGLGQHSGVLSTIVDRLQNLTNATERAPKIAGYMVNREREMSKVNSAFTARRYMGSPDFNRMGGKAQSIRPFVQFWAPQIQGISRNIERAMQDPAYMASWAGALSAGYLGLEAYNRSQVNPETGRPWIEDVPEYERENNIIFVLPSSWASPITYSNGVTRQPMYKIPLGHAAKLLISPIRSMAMNAFGDPAAPSVAQGVSNVASKFLPISGNIDVKHPFQSAALQAVASTTPVFRVPFEQAVDRQAYTDTPIVGKRLGGLEQPEQYTENTSPTAVNIGRKTGISPVRIQHILENLLPGAGQEILNAADLRSRSAMPGSEISTKIPILGSIMSRFMVGKGSAERDRLSEAVYEAAARGDTIGRTLNELEIRDPEAAGRYAEKNEVPFEVGKDMREFVKDLSELRKEREMILRDPGLTPQERTAALAELEQVRMSILRSAQEGPLAFLEKAGIR